MCVFVHNHLKIHPSWSRFKWSNPSHPQWHVCPNPAWRLGRKSWRSGYQDQMAFSIVRCSLPLIFKRNDSNLVNPSWKWCPLRPGTFTSRKERQLAFANATCVLQLKKIFLQKSIWNHVRTCTCCCIRASCLTRWWWSNFLFFSLANERKKERMSLQIIIQINNLRNFTFILKIVANNNATAAASVATVAALNDEEHRMPNLFDKQQALTCSPLGSGGSRATK